jgi:hypothetical protein
MNKNTGAVNADSYWYDREMQPLRQRHGPFYGVGGGIHISLH